MEIGQPYNPWKLFHGAFVPIWLLQRRELTQGAKLAYARLAMYAGERGICSPKVETLGESLGVSRRQAGDYLRELERHGLIASSRPGLGRTNFYHFVWHPWCEEAGMSVRDVNRPVLGSDDAQEGAGSHPDGNSSSHQEGAGSHQDGNQSSRPDRNTSSHPYHEETQVKRLSTNARAGACEGEGDGDGYEDATGASIAGLFFEYFGRLPGGREPQEIGELLEAYPLLTREQWQDAIGRARSWCARSGGGNPKTLAPLRNALADLLNPAAPSNNGSPVAANTAPPPKPIRVESEAERLAKREASRNAAPPPAAPKTKSEVLAALEAHTPGLAGMFKAKAPEAEE